MMKVFYDKRTSACGLSLVEILIAIGILGVTMSLIGAAFPAGVMMSIAVSDETTSEVVFQKALAEIKEGLRSGDIGSEPNLVIMPEDGFDDIIDSRKLEDSPFSWSALVRRMGASGPMWASGPMGNLCQVVVVVSRWPSGSATFKNEDGAGSKLPELRSVQCDDSNKNARTITVASSANFDLVPNGGYIIDSATGTAYAIISRDEGTNNNTVTVLGKPPNLVAARNFWVVPGEYDSVNDKYGRKSPAIRVFQALVYLP